MADEIKQTIVIEASLTKIQGDLKTLEGNFKTSFSKLGNIANQAFGALGISLSAAALISFAKSSFSAVGALQDVSDATGVATDTLLKLNPVLQAAGSSAEELAKIINVMQSKIVDGSAETVATLDKLGISMQEALALADDPEGLLDKLAKGLKSVATQAERVNIERAIGGRGAVKALETLAQQGGLDKIRAEKPIISKEDIAAIDAAGDALNTLKLKLEATVAVKVLPLVEGLTALHDIINKIGDPIQGISDGITGALAKTFPWIAVILKGAEAMGLMEQHAKALDAIASKSSAFRDFPAPSQGGKVDFSTLTFGGAGGAPGKVESDQQKLFNKSLEETIDGLRAQTRALTESGDAATDHAAKILEAKAVTLGFAKGSAELTAKLNEFRTATAQLKQATFADSLVKQNRAIEVQIATMTQGKDEAEKLALKYTLLDSKLKDLGPAATEAANRQRELNAEQARAAVPQALKELDEAKTTARRKQVVLGVTFNADEAIRSSIEQAIDKLASNPDPRVQKLALEAILTLKPQLDASKLKAIKTELGIGLGLDKEFAPILNATFANSFDLAAAKVDRLKSALEKAKTDGVDPLSEGVQGIAARLDQAKIEQAFSDIARDMKVAAGESLIFGRSFDLGSAQVSIIQGKISDLLGQGLSPLNEEVQRLAANLQAAKVADVFSDLQRDMGNSAAAAQVLGGAVDLPAETIGALTNAIKTLIAEGLGPLHPQIQQLKAELEDAKAAERFTEAFQGIASSITGAFQELSSGGKIKDVLKNLASRISSSLTQALVTKPIEDWIKGQMNVVFGDLLGIGKSVGGAAVGTIASKAPDQAALVAIQTASTTANASIQATSLQGQTALTSTATLSQTGITALQTTGVTAITSVEAVALAAIAAAQGTAAIGKSAEFAYGGSSLIDDIFSYHGGGMIRMHGGGEVPVMAQAGEYMMSRRAAQSFGKPTLDYMNTMGRAPANSVNNGGGGRSGATIINIHNPQFQERKSKGKILAEIAAATAGGKRHM